MVSINFAIVGLVGYFETYPLLVGVSGYLAGYDQNSQIWYQGTPDYTAKLTLELTLMDTPLTCHY